MPTAQSAQQTIKQVCNNMTSFFKQNKDYKKNPNKYLGKPKLPKYLNKDGNTLLILTNQNCKLVNDEIKFPKCFNGFKIKTKIQQNEKFINFQQIRIIPKYKSLIIEVVYKIEIGEFRLDNGRYLSIDPGLDNFATITSNVGIQNIILDGKGLKSTNQYFNKTVSKLKSISMIVNKKYTTDKIENLLQKRNNVINDVLHKYSKFVIDYAIKNNITQIYIGHNKFQKQEGLNRIFNQNFIQIPFKKFNEMLIYKGKRVGIKVFEVEESYTSKASFIDKDFIPIYNKDNKENYKFSGSRIKRGLYKTKKGKLVNSDINGALNILRKVKPEAYKKLKEIEVIVSSPIRINLAQIMSGNLNRGFV